MRDGIATGAPLGVPTGTLTSEPGSPPCQDPPQPHTRGPRSCPRRHVRAGTPSRAAARPSASSRRCSSTALAQEAFDPGAVRERGVEHGVRAVLVGADRDQVLLLAVAPRAPRAAAGRRRAPRGDDDLADQARDALQHVDRRVVAGVRERARQHDVAVEDRRARRRRSARSCRRRRRAPCRGR